MNRLSAVDREIDVLRRSIEGLQGDLPKSWRCRVEERPRSGLMGFDALVTLEAPDGQLVVLAVEAKRVVERRDVLATVEQLRAKTLQAQLPNAVPLVVARYLAPSTRLRLEEAGAAYADATGNRYLALDQPALFLRAQGEDRDPWRGPGRPRGSLRGAPAARVVRWLVDVAPPYTALEIARGSGASTGATYRVLKFLEEEELVARQPQGPVSAVRWRPLLERWSRDSGFQRGKPEAALLYPRGLEALVEALRREADLRYVVTGSLAAERYAPYAPPRFAMLYADDVDAVAERLGLRRVDAGANVLVANDVDGVAFVRTREIEGIRFAALSQIAVDLLTGPGRSPAEGEAVLDWMENNERDWRS